MKRNDLNHSDPQCVMHQHSWVMPGTTQHILATTISMDMTARVGLVHAQRAWWPFPASTQLLALFGAMVFHVFQTSQTGPTLIRVTNALAHLVTKRTNLQPRRWWRPFHRQRWFTSCVCKPFNTSSSLEVLFFSTTWWCVDFLMESISPMFLISPCNIFLTTKIRFLRFRVMD